MNETQTSFREYLTKGLKPDGKANRNVPYLETCRGMRPTVFGLRSPALITQAQDASANWKYHKIFNSRMEGLKALCCYPNSTSLELGTRVWSNLATAAVTLPAYSTPITETAAYSAALGVLSEGIDFADFGEVWFASSPENFYFRVPHVGIGNGSAVTNRQLRVYRSVNPTFNAACSINGAVLMLGGINASSTAATYFVGDQWKAIWNSLQNNAENVMTYEESSGTTVSVPGVSKNWVFWSAPYGAAKDFPFSLELAMFGLPNTTWTTEMEGAYLQEIQRGTIGIIQMPYAGEILTIRQLGEQNAAVFGQYGVSIIGPTGNSTGPQYQIKAVHPIGLLNRGAIAGDKNQLIWVDSQGDVYQISAADFSPNRIGYDTYITALQGDSSASNLIGSYDPGQKEFYISNGIRSFLLGPAGASIIPQTPTSLIRTPAKLYAAMGTATDDDFSIITCPFDMGNRELKNIRLITLSSQNIGTVAKPIKILIHFRNREDEAWHQTDYVETNDEETAYLPSTAQEFKLEITGGKASGEVAQIDDIFVHWTQAGKKTLRGLIA